jgi:hypothetical protein
MENYNIYVTDITYVPELTPRQRRYSVFIQYLGVGVIRANNLRSTLQCLRKLCAH